MIPSKIDIHEAAFSGDVRTLKLLLSENGNPNDKDDTGQTPLHRSAMNGWLDCVSVLLEAGAHANATDVSGCTPLHYAAANGYVVIVRHLLEYGKASISIKTKKGHTARHMAKTRAQTKMVALLSEIGALSFQKTKWKEAIGSQNRVSVQIL